MSRIGNSPITVPDSVKLTFQGKMMTAKGPKGTLELEIPKLIDYNFDSGVLTFSRQSELKPVKSIHGLTRALAFNVVKGLIDGFSKTLQIEGVGFKAELKGRNLLLSLGFSHPILFIPPDEIEFVCPKPTIIEIKGIDKQLVGEIASRIRRMRKPEPYKGKGIRYEGEYIRRKAGKTAA